VGVAKIMVLGGAGMLGELSAGVRDLS